MDIQGNNNSQISLHEESIENIKIIKKWMKFISVFYIVIGIIYCLTVVFSIFGWLPIVLGYFLNNSSKYLNQFIISNDKLSLNSSIRGLKNYFLLLGVLLITGLILLFIIILIGIIIFIVIAVRVDDVRGLLW